MSLLHNAEADFAASELARMFIADTTLCYGSTGHAAGLSATAAYEPSASPWPKADGLISIIEGTTRIQRDIALEYKREQEGVHGLLTAMGQAQSYVHKGYNGAAIVVPSQYSSHDNPAGYVSEVLGRAGAAASIGVFRYDPPDVSKPSPFEGRLHCVRALQVTASTSVMSTASRPRTQWVHMREGSTTRDAFLRFLQTAKKMSVDSVVSPMILPKGLRDAVARLAPGKDAEWYLSNTADDKFLSRVWRAFWFEWVLTPEVLQPWVRTGKTYAEPNAFTKIEKDDGSGKSQIFEGRRGSLKSSLVELLNSGSISEDQAWEYFVSGIPAASGHQNKQGVRERAHSYREDLDSSLAHLKWIDADGRPSDSGYRYMTLCERFGGANSTAAVDYVGATLLQAGHYGAFLHYIHRLSERKFSANPLEFTELNAHRMPVFTEGSYGQYLEYLETQLADELKVMRKVSGRGRPRHRTPFQAELTLLRNYGFVSKTRYRLGVGIPIDWERVHDALNVEL